MEQRSTIMQNQTTQSSLEQDDEAQKNPWDGPDWPKCVACISSRPCNVKLAGPLKKVKNWENLSAFPTYPHESDRFFDARREAVCFVMDLIWDFWFDWLRLITNKDMDDYDWFNQIEDLVDMALHAASDKGEKHIRSYREDSWGSDSLYITLRIAAFFDHNYQVLIDYYPCLVTDGVDRPDKVYGETSDQFEHRLNIWRSAFLNEFEDGMYKKMESIRWPSLLEAKRISRNEPYYLRAWKAQSVKAHL